MLLFYVIVNSGGIGMVLSIVAGSGGDGVYEFAPSKHISQIEFPRRAEPS